MWDFSNTNSWNLAMYIPPSWGIGQYGISNPHGISKINTMQLNGVNTLDQCTVYQKY